MEQGGTFLRHPSGGSRADRQGRCAGGWRHTAAKASELGSAKRNCHQDAGRAAYTLKLDHEIGSIECGKRADFCVLEDDPTAVDPLALKDVRVWGTVVGGKAFAVAGG